MADSKKELKDEVAVMHTNCGTYCNPVAKSDETGFVLYECNGCHRKFMLGEYHEAADTTSQTTVEPQAQESTPETSPTSDPIPKRRKKSETSESTS